MELGTKEYPYRSLTLVFAEILNYLSNKNITINIYVKERTTNYLELNKNYIINTQAVNMLTYSDVGFTTEKVNLILTDGTVEIFSSKTQFNILKNADLNITIASTESILAVQNTQKNIFITKSSLSLTYFTITSTYSNLKTDNRLIYPVMLNGKLYPFSLEILT